MPKHIYTHNTTNVRDHHWHDQVSGLSEGQRSDVDAFAPGLVGLGAHVIEAQRRPAKLCAVLGNQTERGVWEEGDEWVGVSVCLCLCLWLCG